MGDTLTYLGRVVPQPGRTIPRLTLAQLSPRPPMKSAERRAALIRNDTGVVAALTIAADALQTGALWSVTRALRLIGAQP